MPKQWTKEDVAMRLAELSNLIATAHRTLLSADFESDRYRYLEEITDAHCNSWRKTIKGMRNERRRNNR